MQSRGTIAVRIVALIFAALLLLPGGCFLRLGIHEGIGEAKAAAFVILSLAAVLFWVAFRRRR